MHQEVNMNIILMIIFQHFRHHVYMFTIAMAARVQNTSGLSHEYTNNAHTNYKIQE